MTLTVEKKFSKILIAVLAIFFSAINVEADCTYVERAKLNEIASNIITNYEVVEENIIKEYVDPDFGLEGTYETIKTSFKINIYNINKEVYLIQKDNLTNESKYIFYNDTFDGVYTFISEDLENIIKYDYQVHSNITGCSGDTLKSYSFIKPKVNMFSQYRMCEGLEDVPYCKVYITEEININESDLEEKLAEYLSDKSDKKTEDKLQIKSNVVYVVLGVSAVIGTLGAIIIVKKRSAI